MSGKDHHCSGCSDVQMVVAFFHQFVLESVDAAPLVVFVMRGRGVDF